MVLLLFGAAAPAMAQSAPARRAPVSAATPAPDDRARQWLVLVDDKNFAQSWKDAGKAFQNRQTVDAWAGDAGTKRVPLGAVASRDLKSIDLSRNNVAVIRYDTSFARKAAAVETITLTFENDGWVVTDYAVN
ncbi:MAG: DUF4019 domain-containing protein [Rhizomicrobium sp.]